MSDSNTDTYLYRLENITGTLSINDISADVTFILACDPKGQVTIKYEPIPLTQANAKLLTEFCVRTRLMPKWRLEGRRPSGEIIYGERAYLSRMLSTEDLIEFEGGAASITVELPEETKIDDSNERWIRFHTVGLEAFGPLERQTDIGQLTIVGLRHIDDYDAIAGYIEVRSSVGSDLEEWTAASTALVKRVLDIVSLAEGRLIIWSIRETFINQKLNRIELFGFRGTGRPFQPCFSMQDLGQVVDLALRSYTDELRQDTDFDKALGWFLVQPPAEELRLTSIQTTLEILATAYANKNERKQCLMDKKIFKQMAKVIVKAINNAPGYIFEYSNAREILSNKVNCNLNQLPNSEKIWNMLRGYDIPLSGVENDVKSALAGRSRATHGGVFSEFPELHRHVAVLREVAKRVFLKLLKYEGQYRSFLNGPEWVRFPPDKTELRV